MVATNGGNAPPDEGRGERSFLNRKQLFARKKIVRHKKCVNRVSRYEKLFVLVFSFRRLLSLTKANHPSRRAANQPPTFPRVSSSTASVNCTRCCRVLFYSIHCCSWILCVVSVVLVNVLLPHGILLPWRHPLELSRIDGMVGYRCMNCRGVEEDIVDGNDI